MSKNDEKMFKECSSNWVYWMRKSLKRDLAAHTKLLNWLLTSVTKFFTEFGQDLPTPSICISFDASGADEFPHQEGNSVLAFWSHRDKDSRRTEEVCRAIWTLDGSVYVQAQVGEGVDDKYYEGRADSSGAELHTAIKTCFTNFKQTRQ